MEATRLTLISLFLASLPFALFARPRLQTIRDLENFYTKSPQPEHDFTFTGIVTHVFASANGTPNSCILDCGESRVQIFNYQSNAVTAGDIATFMGVASVTDEQEPWMYCWHVEKSGHDTPPPVQKIPLHKALDAAEDLRLVRTEGIVMDVIRDEVDPCYDYLLLKDKNYIVYAACPHREQNQYLADATVEVTGVIKRRLYGQRKFLGTCILIESTDNIHILGPPPDDPFSFPPLEKRIYTDPNEIADSSKRIVKGIVLSIWNQRNVLLQSDDGRMIKIWLKRNERQPECGDFITVAGYPTADPYRINLERARVRIDSKATIADEQPLETSAATLLQKSSEYCRYDDRLFGQLITIDGIVRSIQTDGKTPQRLLLECDSFIIIVDVSANPTSVTGILVGSKIRVIGRCVLETDKWQPGNIFPQINNLLIVTRTSSDIKVISRPPWWTSSRLMIVIGVILAALIGSFVWVFTLHRLAERRGHALYRARQAQDAERRTREIAELRMQDRTRLAVELHDTISQNLTGATMQMGTAAQLVETDHVQAIRHLDIATRTLDACREELRNCIWDLRNNALDVPDLNAAIRMTLQRLTGGVMLQIRFNIPREKLPDNTVHALMRIVRELTTNAVRHGAAKTIRIAGALDNGILSFSVTDNGKGFDPENRPGLAEGHFGLQGVEERVEELGGEMKISSKIGKGTRVKIWIKSEC